MIWLILILGLVLRLIAINQSFWLDEAINVLAAKDHSLWEMVTRYVQADFHPPGYFVILWLWSKLFGYSEIAARIPSVIFAVSSVYLVYFLVKRISSQRFALVTSLILAINPLHIYYSQEARMYMFAIFAVVLNYYFFVNLLQGKRSFLGLLLSNILVFGSDYLAYFTFPAQFITLLLLKSKTNIKKWLVSLIPSVILLSFWLPYFIKQINIGLNTASNIPGWKEVVGSTGLKPLLLTYVKFIIGRISYPDKIVYYSLFLPIGTLFLFLLIRGITKASLLEKKVFLSWLFIPIILGLGVSFVIPIFSYFRILFVLPAFIYFVTVGVLTLDKQLVKLLLAIVITVELFCSFIYLFNPNFHRENWRGLVDFLQQQPRSSKIIFESTGGFAPFDYYANGTEGFQAGLNKIPASTKEDVSDLSGLKNNNAVYLIDYLVEITDPNRLVAQQLARLGFIQKGIYNFTGVGFVYKYERVNK